MDVVAGLAIDHQHDDRRGYENYTGLDAQRVLGQIGRLRRDEAGRARSVDGYAQAEVALSERWHLHAGAASPLPVAGLRFVRSCFSRFLLLFCSARCCPVLPGPP